MQEIKQSTATFSLVFFMADETDHVTGLTGLSPTVLLSKNGATFAAPAGAVSEIGNGFYKVAANATDANTLGILALSATATGADQAAMAFSVVENLESDSISQLDTLSSNLASSFAALNDLSAGEVRTELATELGRIDVAVSTRNATTPPDAPAIQTAAAAALTAYDPPTKAELDAAVSPLATAAALATADGVADAILVIANKLDTALELDGAVYRLTANALEQGPAGGGGSGLSAEAIAALAGADQILLASLYTPSESPEVLLPVPSDDGDLCQVFFDSELGTGVPRAGTRVVFRLQGKGILRTLSGKFVDREEVIELTDETGRVTVALEKGLSWTAESETLFGPGGLSFTVPDAAGYNLNTMEEV